MDNLHSSSKFLLCSSLIFILLLSNTFVFGRSLKKRNIYDYNNRTGGYYPSNYPTPNSQPSTGNHLYPTLDLDSLTRPYLNPYENRGRNLSHHSNNNFNWNSGPFDPYPNKGLNFTHRPNFNFSHGNVHPIVHPNNRNFSSGWNVNPNPHNQHRVQLDKPFPNNDFNVNHGYNNQQTNAWPNNGLPTPKTTCGKTLCSYVVNYPTKEISSAVERAREALRSGYSNTLLRNKGLSIYNFNSNTNSASLGGKTTGSVNSLCRTKTDTIYPHEGFSSDDNTVYYVVNIPNLSQTLSNVECDGSSDQTCSRRVMSMSEARICQQTYRKVPLLALPFGKRNFDINDFQLRMFDVPSGCNCVPYRRGY